MRSNFKLLWVFCLLSVFGLGWQGCQSQQPTAAALAPPAKDLYSLFDFKASNVGLVNGTPGSYTNISGMVNTSLYHESNEPAITTSSAFAKVSDYGVTPVTVISGPLPYSVFPSTVPYSTYNPENHPYIATTYTNSPLGSPTVASNFVWTSWFQYSIVTTQLPDPTAAYGVSISGIIEDPENSAYPPGPGNIDPIAFEWYPYFPNASAASPGYNGSFGLYDLTPFQGFEFYVYLDLTDTAIEREFLVNTFQSQPNAASYPGGCNNPDYPYLNHCYDSFEYDFTNSPKGQWVLIQKNWGDFKQFGFGSQMNPSTLSGVNLQQFQFFQWVESNAAQAGPVTVNFSLAGMRFF